MRHFGIYQNRNGTPKEMGYRRSIGHGISIYKYHTFSVGYVLDRNQYYVWKFSKLTIKRRL